MDKIIKNTVDQLRLGKIILYPTDTVWGLGCDILNKNAVDSIYEIKKRVSSKALIILVSSIEMLKEYVIIPDDKLSVLNNEKPLTVIYSNTKNIPNYLTANDGSIAVRITKDPFCKELIDTFGKPIISTSANISGNPTPSIFSEIDKTILSDVDYVVNWRQDDKSKSLPSKIIKFTGKDEIEIIRE